MPKQVCIWGLTGLPEVKPGDDLARLLADAAAAEGVGLEDGDVVVVTSKVVSKAEGRVVRRESVRPGRAARGIARATGKDPREVQVILDSCRSAVGVIPLGLALRYLGSSPFWGDPGRVREAVRRESTLLVTVMPGGGLATDAGVDCSNVPAGFCVLPPDPDASARRLRDRLRELTGKEVAVVLADTEFRVLRQGTTDVAVGVAGMEPVRKQFGNPDRFGRPKVGGMDAVADLIAGAAALVMGQTGEGIPAVVMRGLKYVRAEGRGANLTMPARWLRWGMVYFLWSALRLWVARAFGL